MQYDFDVRVGLSQRCSFGPASPAAPDICRGGLAISIVITAFERSPDGGRGLARAETVATALKLAEDRADKPDVSLRLLKQAMNHRLRLDLPDVIAREKAMHEAAFAQSGVIDRINQRLGR